MQSLFSVIKLQQSSLQHSIGLWIKYSTLYMDSMYSNESQHIKCHGWINGFNGSTVFSTRTREIVDVLCRVSGVESLKAVDVVCVKLNSGFMR